MDGRNLIMPIRIKKNGSRLIKRSGTILFVVEMN